MALNFPNNPANNATYTAEGVTWRYDGTAWNLVYTADVEVNQFTTFTADSGSSSATVLQDTLTINGGTNVTTSISGKTLTINAVAESQSGALDAFKTVVSDDGQAVAVGTTATLGILGGTNIFTTVVQDTRNVQINLDSFSVNFLSDVDTATNPPSAGSVLKWDGSKWAPGIDATTGGIGLDAQTLNGQLGSYYLNYNNLTNTPATATLTSFSVGVEPTPSGNGAIAYDNTTGIFRYTPPTAAGLGALTTEVNNLSNAVVWANVPNANITQGSVTQHQAALSVTESQISNLRSYLLNINSLSVNELIDVDTVTSAPSNGQVLGWNSVSGRWVPTTVTSGGTASNSFETISVAGQTSVVADGATDTLTLAAGSGITITTTAGTDTVTIASTVVGGVSDFSQLADVIRADTLTVDNIFEAAIATLRMGAVGFQAYTIDSHYSGDNPTVYAISGTTIAFDLNNVPGHPTVIQDGAGNNYNTGLVHVSANGAVLTGAAAQGKREGTLYWRIQESVSGTFRYQCTAHAPMFGPIIVKRLSLL